jgi:hypothetical protein
MNETHHTELDTEHARRLAAYLDQELKRLPDLPAPPTLLPRVLAAVRLQAKPVWQRPWVTWPVALRVGFLATAAALLLAVGFLGQALLSGVSVQPLVSRLSESLAFLDPALKLAGALVNAFTALVRSGGQVLWWGMGSILLTLYLACVALGTLCYRAVSNKL